jgi:xanthine/CO dehydrogenase XdhC/CoxF family maturation factor
MGELADTARRWVAEGRRAVLARPITEQGFGPRHPADAILVDEDGTCRCTLHRVVFDEHLAAEAAALLAEGHTARVCEVSVHDDDVLQAGLTCGGQAEILLQPLDVVPARWWTVLGEGTDAALITRLDEGQTEAVSTVATPEKCDDTAEEGPAQAVDVPGISSPAAGRAATPASRRTGSSSSSPSRPYPIWSSREEASSPSSWSRRPVCWAGRHPWSPRPGTPSSCSPSVRRQPA